MHIGRHFVRTIGQRLGLGIKTLSPEAEARLIGYDWPGNVRHLGNTIERAVVLHASGGGAIGFDLHETISEEDRTSILDEAQEKRWTFEELEREYIFRVLESVRWKKTEAAEILGIDRRTLYRKLKRFETEGTPSPG